MTAPARLPERMRVFEFARHLEIPAAVLLTRLQQLDLDVQTVLKAIDRESMRLVLEDFRTDPDSSEDAPSVHVLDQLLAEMVTTPEEEDQTYESETNPTDDPDEGAQAAEEPAEVVPGDLLEREHPVIRLAVPTDFLESGQEDADQDDAKPGPPSEDSENGDYETTIENASGNGSAPRYGRPPGWTVWEDSSAAEESNEAFDSFANLEESEPLDIDADENPDRQRGFEPQPDSSVRRSFDPRRRILTVAAVILLGTVTLSLLYAFLRPTYAAESDLVIGLSGLGSEEIGRELQSFAVLTENQAVLAPVATEFDMTVAELRESLDSEILGDSRVLRFTTTASDPDTALALNEAVVTSFLELANEPVDLDQLDFVESQVTEAEQRLSQLDARIETLQAEEATNSATRFQIETDRGVAQARLAELEGRLVELNASESPVPSSIAFVENQITETQTRLDETIAAALSLESADAEVRNEVERLLEERSVVRSELGDFNSLQLELELEQIRGSRVALLAPSHPADDPVGLTPTRAVALGVLVGGFFAFAWVVGATQLRRKR